MGQASAKPRLLAGATFKGNGRYHPNTLMTETKQTSRHSRLRTAAFLRSYRFSSLSWGRLGIVRFRRPFQIFLALCLVLATTGFALHALGLLYEGRYSVTRQDYWRIYTLDLACLSRSTPFLNITITRLSFPRSSGCPFSFGSTTIRLYFSSAGWP